MNIISKNDIINHEIYYKIIEIHDNRIISRIPFASISEVVIIVDNNYQEVMKAEVVKVEDNNIVSLIPFKRVDGLSRQSLIKKSGTPDLVRVGLFLRGEILNGFGEIISGVSDPDVSSNDFDFINYNCPTIPSPLARKIISEQFLTHVKSVDFLIPCGFGQRLLICAQAGVGKTTLISMIANTAQVLIIINLIGERGREVNEFLASLDNETRKNSIFIISTSDASNFEKVKSFYLSHSIASWLRSKGHNVILIVDSVTRFARALREISLSTGSPEIRGYTSTVFNILPSILESCGIDEYGSITAFYTALFEGDNINNDPLIEEMKSITDGHIVLSRKIANSNRYPAIDFLASISRIYNQITSDEHQMLIKKVLSVYNKYNEIELMLRIGEYKIGNNNEIDEIINLYEKLNSFFSQRFVNSYNSIDGLINEVKLIIKS